MSISLILGIKAASADLLHVPISRNLGALTSWNPVGLFRTVMGELYFTFYLRD
jgi:hypothetical protein